MTEPRTNAELVAELKEVCTQYANGLLSDYELLAKATEIGAAATPDAPVTDEELKRDGLR
jgi:hypothetical protein